MSNSRSARPMARGHRTPCRSRRSACVWIFRGRIDLRGSRNLKSRLRCPPGAIFRADCARRGMKTMMKHRWLNITIAGALMLSLGVMITPMFSVRGMARPTAALVGQPQKIAAAAVAANAAQLAGDYIGAVKLQFTAAGVYSDTLATPPPPAAGQPEPPDLGTIDRALKLSQNGSALSGYVSLGKTLVFAAAHTIKNGSATLNIGPYVNGSFDGTNLTLVSERVAATLSGQPIQRQFRLSGAISASDGSRISGEYRETMWGATHQPVTVVGAFTLQRPVF